jgi:hypothetical protein
MEIEIDLHNVAGWLFLLHIQNQLTIRLLVFYFP